MPVPSGIRTASDRGSSSVILGPLSTGPIADQVLNYPVAKEKGSKAIKKGAVLFAMISHGREWGEKRQVVQGFSYVPGF